MLNALDNPESISANQNDEEISPEFFNMQENALHQEIASNLSSYESKSSDSARTQQENSTSDQDSEPESHAKPSFPRCEF